MKNLRLKLLLLCVMGIITLGASATPDKNYLCFTANTANSTVELVKKGKAYNVIMQYSTDEGESWQTIDFSTATTTGTITLEKANDKVYFRNIRPASKVYGFSKDYSGGYNHYQFVMSGSIAASGNVMSLVDSDVETTTIPNEYCFADLFYECSALTSAPELPATTLKNYCYYEMFYRCTSLAKAPELPAMNLAEGCYYELFSCCKNLTIAPALPANELKEYCYFRTFEDCISLTEGPELNAMNLAEDCYTQMFYGCTGLQFAPALPATELVYSCYDGMFFDCTNLQSAPELNALKLAEYCYLDMFRGCTSLKTAPTLPAQSLENYCYCGMFFDCTNLQSAPVLPAATMKLGCYYRMFEGCKSLTSAPSLPAKDLAERCYEYMFGNCTNLMIAPELPATELADCCYLEMFYSCEKLTEAPDLPATTLCKNCYNRMFVYCTNLKSIKVGFTDWYDNAATYEWLDGTAADGVFICPDELPMYYDWYYGVPYNWTRAYEVKANKDPESVNYYSTFYSGTNAYEVPEGVTAYTGVAEGNVLNLTPVADGIIPADEAVILKASQSQVYLQYTTTTATKSTDNMLEGTDEETTLSANQYALSLGQKGVGFYLWEGKEIGANKAYLTLNASFGAKAFTFQFEDEITGINDPQLPTLNSQPTYNLNGVRVNGNYKGIVIKNGKKIYNK